MGSWQRTAGAPKSAVLKLEVARGLAENRLLGPPRLSACATGSWSSPGRSNCERQRHLVVRVGVNLECPAHLSSGGARGSRMIWGQAAAPRQNSIDPGLAPQCAGA